jgi:mono/diheme cytochrome c family protein
VIRLVASLAAFCVLAAACSGPAIVGSDDLAGGRDTFGTCAACHGGNGTGGVGPALASVRETFPDCETQIEWVRLGSTGWQEEHGETYGAPGKPVNGGMPSFAELGDREIRQVVLYERVRFGGADEVTEAEACGLASPTP